MKGIGPYVIRKGVPLPPKRRPLRSPISQQIERMAPGDSFLFPSFQANSALQAVRAARKRHPEWTIELRTVDEEYAGIWRVR